MLTFNVTQLIILAEESPKFYLWGVVNRRFSIMMNGFKLNTSDCRAVPLVTNYELAQSLAHSRVLRTSIMLSAWQYRRNTGSVPLKRINNQLSSSNLNL